MALPGSPFGVMGMAVNAGVAAPSRYPWPAGRGVGRMVRTAQSCGMPVLAVTAHPAPTHSLVFVRPGGNAIYDIPRRAVILRIAPVRLCEFRSGTSQGGFPRLAVFPGAAKFNDGGTGSSSKRKTLIRRKRARDCEGRTGTAIAARGQGNEDVVPVNARRRNTEDDGYAFG